MKTIKVSIGYAVLCAVLVNCGGGGDGGGGVGKPTVPNNAIVITEANAPIVAEDTYDSFDAALSAQENVLGVEITTEKQKNIILRSIQMVKDNIDVASVDAVNGININVTIQCGSLDAAGSGSFSVSGTEDDVTEAFNGTIAFNNCKAYGSAIDGSLTVNETCVFNSAEDSCTGKVTSASFKVSFSGESVEITNLTLNFDESDIYPGPYTESYDYAISSTLINGGVLVETTIPFKGDWLISSNPYEGQVVLTGASGSKLRITAIDSTEFMLEVDAAGTGTWTVHPGSPFLW